jgi:hypothetical protein
MASRNVLVPEGGVELCVQAGRRPWGSPAKPSFDHEKPDSLPLEEGEWMQFKTKVRDAIAGMNNEGICMSAWKCGRTPNNQVSLCENMLTCVCIPIWLLFLLFVFLFFVSKLEGETGRRLRAGTATTAPSSPNRDCSLCDHENDGDNDPPYVLYGVLFAVIASAFAGWAVRVCWVVICNKGQDWLISDACCELAMGSRGRLTAEYHTFLTYPNRAFGSQPPRVIVIAPRRRRQPVQAVQAVVVAQPAQAYLVDNSAVKGAVPLGLGYRNSTNVQDIDWGECAPWGSIVHGVDQKDGWVRVGNRFLPMQLYGVTVLKLLESQEEVNDEGNDLDL